MIGYHCVEDPLSRSALVRVIEHCHAECYLTELQPGQGGNSFIKKRLAAYCDLADNANVFILTDLDDAECAPSLKNQWFDKINRKDNYPPGMFFSVAVCEIESWLIADYRNFSDFTGVSPDNLKFEISTDGTKERMLEAIKHHGSQDAKREMLPDAGVRAKVGLGYNRFLCEFTESHWDVENAAREADSLQRAIDRISRAPGYIL